MAGVSFFAYALAVFVAMLTGNIFAMPFYYLAVNYLWIGCMKMVQNISSLICYGVSDTWTSSQTSRLSPLDYLIRNLVMGVKYDKDYVCRQSELRSVAEKQLQFMLWQQL